MYGLNTHMGQNIAIVMPDELIGHMAQHAPCVIAHA